MLPSPDPFELLGPDLSSALAKKGYTSLTEVQKAVLDPALADRDLRISSQTGSGKTLAIGFAVRHCVEPSAKPSDGIARPYAVVIVPTRELAKQVEAELAWLYAPSKLLVASVIGGASVRDEYRQLARGPAVIVGTPGRLLDHLTRGAILLERTGALVLDEADRMLDLGFREDLEAILGRAPEGHRTHLVSATFPREVEALAQRVQSDPASIQGTPLGSANADIDHIVHLVKPNERVDALINLLLSAPGEQVLAFARTRADVADACEALDQAGFAVDSLSGEMEQPERQRALSAFKNGKLQVLVATDVAARGIDHQDIARVVQLEPPMDADTYTHRSGRTGRAGRKGKSSIMVQPAGLPRLTAMLKRARVRFRFEAIPTAESIAAAQDEKLISELTVEPASDGSAVAPTVSDRTSRLAARLVASGAAERALAVLLERVSTETQCAPREITPLTPNAGHQNRGHGAAPRPGHRNGRPMPPARDGKMAPFHGNKAPFHGMPPVRGGSMPPVRSKPPARDGKMAPFHGMPPVRGGQMPPMRSMPPARDGDTGDGWVRFRVSWGQAQGADVRRLLPMLCRRGNIRGKDIGTIQLAPSFSFVDVATRVAADFERAARRPDPRDPSVTVRRA
ncbi:MAG TPA: DEAD/DEAH box helicase [Polyangiaceae bacterium]